MVNKDLVKRQSEGFIHYINEKGNLGFKPIFYSVESFELYDFVDDTIRESFVEEFTFECIIGKYELRLNIKINHKKKLGYPYILRWRKEQTIGFSEKCKEGFESSDELINFILNKFK